MRGDDNQQEGMFSYISPEKRVPADHPLRPIRKMVDEILKEMTPHVGVQLRELRRHLLQDLIHHLADRSQRMIRRYALLRGNVAEHSFLLLIVAAHSLVSFVFLH